MFVAPFAPAESKTAKSIFIQESPIPAEIIQWDEEAGNILYLEFEGRPFLILSGVSKQLVEIQLDSQKFLPTDGRFEIRLELFPEERTHSLKLISGNKQQETYAFSYRWLKPIEAYSFKGKRIEQVVAENWVRMFWLVKQPSFQRSRLNLRSFGASLAGFSQKLGGNCLSLQAGWLPDYKIADRWTIGIDLQIIPLKRRAGKMFWGIESMALAHWAFSKRWLFGGALGAETWLEYGGLKPAAGFRVQFVTQDYANDRFSFGVSHLVFGYNAILAQNFTHHLKLGAKVEF